MVVVANSTPVAVRDIRFLIQYRDDAGLTRSREDVIRGPIPSGQRGERNTMLGPYQQGASCPVQLTGARIDD